MTNFQFLQTYVELQKDIMFDELLSLDSALICYSENDPSPFWNNALVDSNLKEQLIKKIESVLITHKRTPAFYFENRPELSSLTDQLKQLHYHKEAEDSLMFHSAAGIDESRFHLIQKVESHENLEVFLQTFDACYRKDDPVNPYGELGEYINATKIAWEKHHANGRLEYFIAYKENLPVAVSSLTNFKEIGYISNVGSLRSVRGEGFGKLATLYCVAQSKKHGNTQHCLATEEGTNPNAFYRAIGFKTRFTALLMAKNKLSGDKS